jgi:hypothetical protein
LELAKAHIKYALASTLANSAKETLLREPSGLVGPCMYDVDLRRKS